MSVKTIPRLSFRGEVTPPPSKSYLHRAAICAALARGEAESTPSVITNFLPCDDTAATLNVLSALSAETYVKDGRLYIFGLPKDVAAPSEALDCFESGSTLRFLIPVLSALGISYTITGRGRLPDRPLDAYLSLLPKHGLTLKYGAKPLPLSSYGKLSGGEFLIGGNVSSQYITGLLLALPLCGGGSVTLTSPLESAAYVDMTAAVMSDFGVAVDQLKNSYCVSPQAAYRPCDYSVESDWSAAAFFMVAGVLSGEVTLCGLNPKSLQGDREIFEIIRRFGGRCELQNGKVTASKSRLHGITVDVSQIPDTVPAICALAAFAEGKTVITGAGRLRLKESDRLSAGADNLRRLGCEVSCTPDSLTITGTENHNKSAALSGYGDHRIVMAFSVAAAIIGGDFSMTDAECVAKSYPSFWEDFERLGGNKNVQ